MNLRRLDVPTLRGALWAARALRQVRSGLREHGLRFGGAPTPPALPPHAARGVAAVLRRRQSTCLERALVLQRWHLAQGRPRDVVIAVKSPTSAFAAHAWLEGEPDGDVSQFSELIRLPAR